MFVDLSEKNILFVGAGAVNAGRIEKMLDFAGRISVVAPEATAYFKRLLKDSSK